MEELKEMMAIGFEKLKEMWWIFLVVVTVKLKKREVEGGDGRWLWVVEVVDMVVEVVMVVVDVRKKKREMVVLMELKEMEREFGGEGGYRLGVCWEVHWSGGRSAVGR